MITDTYLRTIRCLRISVTNMCNLRCVYCIPQKGFELMRHGDILTFEEITDVVRHAVRLGIDNIRLTGGEPLVRKDIQRLVSMLLSVEGISSLTMTTNGTLLKEYAAILKQNGLARLNISLDTLNSKKYAEITRGGNIKEVFNGIDEALKVGFKNTKINVVVMRGINDCELSDFARLSIDRELEVRFIELMTSGTKSMAEEGRFVPSEEIFHQVRDVGRLIPIDTHIGYGPAKMYKVNGAIGKIGFISPVSKPFCGNCNRLRLTSDGKLRSCLLRGGEVDIKGIIRARQDDTRPATPQNDIVGLVPFACPTSPARLSHSPAPVRSGTGGQRAFQPERPPVPIRAGTVRYGRAGGDGSFRRGRAVGQSHQNDKAYSEQRESTGHFNKTSQMLEDAFRQVSTMKPVSHSGSGAFEMQHIGG